MFRLRRGRTGNRSGSGRPVPDRGPHSRTAGFLPLPEPVVPGLASHPRVCSCPLGLRLLGPSQPLRSLPPFAASSLALAPHEVCRVARARRFPHSGCGSSFLLSVSVALLAPWSADACNPSPGEGRQPYERNSTSCPTHGAFSRRHFAEPQGPLLTVNLHSPPRSSLLSKQVGSSPSSRQHLTDARPLTPAPTIATRLAMVPCVRRAQRGCSVPSESPAPTLAAAARFAPLSAPELSPVCTWGPQATALTPRWASSGAAAESRAGRDHLVKHPLNELESRAQVGVVTRHGAHGRGGEELGLGAQRQWPQQVWLQQMLPWARAGPAQPGPSPAATFLPPAAGTGARGTEAAASEAVCGHASLLSPPDVDPPQGRWPCPSWPRWRIFCPRATTEGREATWHMVQRPGSGRLPGFKSSPPAPPCDLGQVS